MDSTACIKITKNSFLQSFCQRRGYTLKEALDAYDTFIETLLDEVLKGNKVVFPGFGSFFLRTHKSHKIFSVQGKTNVDDYLMFKFQPSPTFCKQYLKNNDELLTKIRNMENSKKGQTS